MKYTLGLLKQFRKEDKIEVMKDILDDKYILVSIRERT